MSNKKTMLGFVAGAAVGALAGILFAPEKGSETRKKINTKTGDLTESVKSSFGDFVDNLKNVYAKSEDKAGEYKDKAAAKMNNLQSEMKVNMDNPFS